jgi:hypothetical protein
MSGEALGKARSKLQAVQRGALVAFAVLMLLVLASRGMQLDWLTRIAERQTAGASASAALAPAARQAAPTAAAAAPRTLTCTPMENTELWGDVVKPGLGPGAVVAATAAECCDACARTHGCNAWVYCSDERACQQQCWLKWQINPNAIVKHSASSTTPWTSGVHLKDYDDGTNPYEPGDAQHIALQTAEGPLRIRLHPDWSAGSVAYARRVARHGLCTAKCVFYRAEPGFLLQGALHAVIKANNETRTRGRGVAMERGDVAWAGGFSGPDFFITHVRVPGFGASHTVWGSLEPESLAVLDRLIKLPASSGPGGGMRMLGEPVVFDAVSDPS